MARYIDIDKAIPMMIQMCVDIVGHGITQVDAVRIATMLEDASVEDIAPRGEVAKLEQDVARLVQEKDELVRKIFEELGDYAADFVAGHIDDDNLLRAIYTLKAKYTNLVQCKDCKHLMFSDCYGECSKGHRGIVKPDDSCEFGEKFRREGRNE